MGIRSWDVAEEAYPHYRDEEELIAERRRACRSTPRAGPTTTSVDQWQHRDLLGVGISGGGVRSATFSLGVFQALAAERSEDGKTLLQDIDFLSTVSGGGYFGGFYGSLFLPDRQEAPSGVEQQARAPAVPPSSASSRASEVEEQAQSTIPGAVGGWQRVQACLASDSDHIRYLRENGAYLAPAGPGDLLLGATVLARNWVAVILVLVSVIVAACLSIDLALLWGFSKSGVLHGAVAALIAAGAPFGLLLSPLFLPAFAVAVVGLVPIGYSYFVSGSSLWVPSGAVVSKRVSFWLGTLLVQVAGAWSALYLHYEGHGLAALCLAVMTTALMVGRTCGDAAGVQKVNADGRERAASPPRRMGRTSFGALALLAATGSAGSLIAVYGPAFLPSTQWLCPLEWSARGPRGYRIDALWTEWVAPYAFLAFFVLLADVLLQVAAWALTQAIGRFSAAGSSAAASHMDQQSGPVNSVHGDGAAPSSTQGARTPRVARSAAKRARLLDVDQYVRHVLSVWLKSSLVAFSLLVMLGIMHTLARTIYAHSLGGVEGLLSTICVLGSALAAGARRLVVHKGEGSDTKRPGWLLSGAQYLGGGAALAVLLTLGLVLAQVVLFRGEGPIVPRLTAPLAVLGTAGMESPDAELRHDGALRAEWSWARLSAQDPSHKESPSTEGPLAALDVAASTPAPDPRYSGDPRDALERNILKAGLPTLAGLLLFLLAVGTLRRFLNNSTHLALYSARITRTFLGATNPDRVAETPRAQSGVPPAASGKASTHLIAGDDVDLVEYFRHPCPSDTGPRSPYSLGAPLHLINVTINETIDGRSKTQQSDRRGVGMAVGPLGLSVGVRHHAVFAWDQASENFRVDRTDTTHPDVKVHPTSGDYRVFGADRRSLQSNERGRIADQVRSRWPGEFPGERLSLGRWLGISGAAFTTGLGSRTNVGLSLMLGLSNVRLGHWWWPGVRPPFRWSLFVGWFCWVQQYLLRELFARFSGTADRLWYLSDGGHFENLGGYELLRRRLKKIILIDAEADPERTFEGLGNLVRKARLDFGAEVEFLDAAELEAFPECQRRGIGTLEQLRPSANGWSLAHAALARVIYPRLAPPYTDPPSGESSVRESPEERSRRTGWLLYIKPSMLGTEPRDCLQYHSDHREFPHQSTGDQFFDEAQWESYRRLGERIGRRLFDQGTLPVSTL